MPNYGLYVKTLLLRGGLGGAKTTTMSNIKSKFKSNLNFNAETVLDSTAQNQVNGGLLLYCEDKRVGSMTIPVWKAAINGKIGITVKM